MIVLGALLLGAGEIFAGIQKGSVGLRSLPDACLRDCGYMTVWTVAALAFLFHQGAIPLYFGGSLPAPFSLGSLALVCGAAVVTGYAISGLLMRTSGGLGPSSASRDAALVLSAIPEELVYRAVLACLVQRVLPGSFETIFVVVSTLLFALAHHRGGVSQVAVAASAGVLLSLVFVESHSVLLCITLHALFNSRTMFLRAGARPGQWSGQPIGVRD